jgi:hypothetical protein
MIKEIKCNETTTQTAQQRTLQMHGNMFDRTPDIKMPLIRFPSSSIVV